MSYLPKTWTSGAFQKRGITMRKPEDWLAHYGSVREEEAEMVFRHKPGTDPHLKREYKNKKYKYGTRITPEQAPSAEVAGEQHLDADGNNKTPPDEQDAEPVPKLGDKDFLGPKMDSLQDWLRKFGPPDAYNAQLTSTCCRDREQDFGKLTVIKMKQKFSVFFGKRIRNRHPEMRTQLPDSKAERGVLVHTIATSHPNQEIPRVETWLEKTRKANALGGLAKK
ncbi:unnamed protein product [Amoebophrya sp. A120]|nr:unnamed protein product [Amoebophrya sp. A120]|eukprot:GSA120T00012881001.1